MRSAIDKILEELGMETPDLIPLNKREAMEQGLIQGAKKPEKGPCGKSVYASESHCDQAIKKRLRDGFGGTSFLRSYYCQQCAGYHMSSSHTKLNK